VSGKSVRSSKVTGKLISGKEFGFDGRENKDSGISPIETRWIYLVIQGKGALQFQMKKELLLLKN
jgi:hypothetical protein